MRNDDNYYGYHNDYDSGMLYLMEQPALRPLGDAPVWLKHALLMLSGKLLQWVLATVLMFASIIAMGSVLLFALGALGINQAVQQKEMWAWAVVLIVVWFINMLPMVFSAGFVAIAAGVAEDGEFAFRRLFAGFGEQFGQLVKLALFWMLAAFALFGETLTPHRAVGLLLAFAALACLLIKPQKTAVSGSLKTQIACLIGVWLGYGVIDILFKQLSKTAGTGSNLLVMFALAGVLMAVYLVAQKARWTRASIIGGIVLGSLNFVNILFYLKAHRAFSGNPTLVFAGMNMGVIALGALVGAGGV